MDIEIKKEPTEECAFSAKNYFVKCGVIFYLRNDKQFLSLCCLCHNASFKEYSMISQHYYNCPSAYKMHSENITSDTNFDAKSDVHIKLEFESEDNNINLKTDDTKVKCGQILYMQFTKSFSFICSSCEAENFETFDAFSKHCLEDHFQNPLFLHGQQEFVTVNVFPDIGETNFVRNEKTVIADDQEELIKLLKKFDLEHLFPTLNSVGITFRSLKFLSTDDINLSIKNIGLRAEFREKLFAWRKKKFGKEDDTVSINSKVNEWLDKISKKLDETISASRLNETQSYSYVEENENISSLLNETAKGKSIIKHYIENGSLTNSLRDELIKIIIEAAIYNNKNLKPPEFLKIIDQIICLFPSEKNYVDYYYIPRQRKKNPSGKLYAKYSNTKSKTRKITVSDSPCSLNNHKDNFDYEIDDSVAVTLKTYLSNDTESTDWNEVVDNWENTFMLRQRELKQLPKVDFLNEWPKFSDLRAPDLIKIDFNLMYPDKGMLLYDKWELFKEKVKKYYELNILNKSCKKIFADLKTADSTDTEDYILTFLLNSVLMPSARFKDDSGNNKRKVTIDDALESFILRLDSINKYQMKIDEVVAKYYNIGRPVQLLMIVEGISDLSVKSFHVYFNKILYKFDSFIDSLDICFKIFQVIRLDYPPACHLVWNFIQKFFYEINTSFDIKSSSLTSLLNHMETE